MHVLVGTDGSEEAVAAAGAGVAMLDDPSTVTVVCAIDLTSVQMSGKASGFAGGMVTESEMEAIRERENSAASAALDATVAAVGEAAPNATVETRVVDGDAGRVLVRLAEELDVDTVVVGSQGKGALKRALLGSVSSTVVNNAPCPVVVVRRGTD